MKAKLLLVFLMCSVVCFDMMAQCSVQILTQQNAGSATVAFAADSVTDGGNGFIGTPSFFWTFSDGTTATGSRITHQFNLVNGGAADFLICLNMIDSATGCNVNTCDTITVSGNPVGACTTSVSYTNVDSVYTFVTNNGGVAPYTYQWAVNGQLVSVAAVLTETLEGAMNGNYNEVCVSVTDSSGCVASDCAYISNNAQGNCNAYAVYTYHDSVYTFIASYIGVGPVTYQWSYNNNLYGSGDSLTIVIDSSTLGPNGAAVCVMITDANGCMATSCATVNDTFPVGQAPCQAYFVISGANLNGDSSGNYYGYNYSTGNYGSNVLWDFGDGTTSTDPYPTHVYAQPGIYIVCLTIGVPGTSCYSTYCDSSFYVSRSAVLMHSFSVSNPTGINQVNASAVISVYPNPVLDELNITGLNKMEQVRVFNVAGQNVFEAKGVSSRINVSKLNAGVYILEIANNGIVLRTKFVKE